MGGAVAVRAVSHLGISLAMRAGAEIEISVTLVPVFRGRQGCTPAPKMR